eukprot:1595443-Rhodomonas_salina.1
MKDDNLNSDNTTGKLENHLKDRVLPVRHWHGPGPCDTRAMTRSDRSFIRVMMDVQVAAASASCC